MIKSNKKIKNKSNKSPRERYDLGSFVTQNASVAGQYQSQIDSVVKPQGGGAGKGAVSGLATGASIGTSILPGWGTAIGAVVGGVGGLLFGGAAERREQRRYQNQINNLNEARSNITQDLYLSSIDTNNSNPYGTYAEGGQVLPNITPTINIEKGELQINPETGKILREYKGINPETGGKYEPHAKGRKKDSPNNIVTAEENTFIITKKEASKYKDAVDNNDKLHQNSIMSNIRNQKNKQIDKYQDGGRVMNFDQFTKYYDKDPNDKLYNIRQAYNIYRTNPSKFEDPEMGIASREQDGWHFSSVDPNTNIFLKHKNHPTVNKELDWYNSNEGADFRSKFALDSTQNYYKYVPKKPKYALGGNVNNNLIELASSGVTPNLNFNIPSLNPNAINYNKAVSNISPGFDWNTQGANVISQATNYLPSLYNIFQGSRSANTMPYTPVRINPQARQNILANLPTELSANPALNNIRAARNRTYRSINNNTSNPSIARANRLAVEDNFLNAENEAVYNNQLANNQIRSQRASILSGLDAQDQNRTAQNVNLLNNTLLTNRQMQQGKTDQLNYGISQFGQMLQANKTNAAKRDRENMELEILRQVFPALGQYYPTLTGGR